MSGNGSYQKDGNSATYQSIDGSVTRGGSKKWYIAAAVLAMVGAIVFYVTEKPVSTDTAIAKANLPVSKSGKLKLFDDESKCQFLCISLFILTTGVKAKPLSIFLIYCLFLNVFFFSSINSYYRALPL